MIKFVVLFIIFFTSTSFAQSQMFWNQMNVPFHRIITLYGAPDAVELQDNCEYWLAYNYGNKNIVYVIDKAMVTSILYLEQIDNYSVAETSFMKLDSMSTSDGFETLKLDIRFVEKRKNEIKLQLKIVENFNSYIIAIQIKGDYSEN